MDHELPPDPPKPPRGGRPAPRPPVPPVAGMLRGEESPLMQYMRQRMDIMERELIKERERSLASENLLKQQESMRGEVEEQLKSLSDQIKQERRVQDLQEDKSASRGRVDSLEKRLDEMHNTWAELVKTAVEHREREVGLAGPEAAAIVDTLAALRTEVATLKIEMAKLPDLLPEVQQLVNRGPSDLRRRTEEEKALREHLQAMVDRMAESLVERLGGMDRRLATEFASHRERIEAMSRERDSLRETMDEERQRARTDFLRERVSLEAEFNKKLEGIHEALRGVSDEQSGGRSVLEAVEGMAKQLHVILTRPEKAKDQILLDVEQEKKDLLRALRERTEQLRAYTLERREVEHTLGESLMELNRQLEGERSKEFHSREHVAGLESSIEALKAEISLRDKETAQEQERFRQLAAERDKLVEALTLEADKVRRQIDDRMESERRWEVKILDFQKIVHAERESRLQAERTSADLRLQIQTLSDHIARVLRDKEHGEREQAEWLTKRKEIDETLRKKDEMISMLSATFQNLLKKPE